MLTGIALGSVLGYGSLLVRDGQLTQGALAAYLVYALVISGEAVQGLITLGEVSKAGGALARCRELLEGQMPTVRRCEGERPESFTGAISFHDVTFAYPSRPERPALVGLTLYLAAGSRLALVGHLGAGKSTVGLLVQRLYEPSSGCICLDGRVLSAIEPRWLKSHLGVVAQEPLLFSDTCRNNILVGSAALESCMGHEDVVRAAQLACVDEFIRELPQGYEALVGERGVLL